MLKGNSLSTNVFIWTPLLFLLSYFLYTSWSFPIHDFANYYFGGKLMFDGLFDTSTYNAISFNESILDKYQFQSFSAYYPNTPTLALFYSIFSTLEWNHAKLSINALGVVLFLVAINGFGSQLKNKRLFILLIPLVFFLPIKNNLLFGQSYLILCSLILLGYILLEKKELIRNLFGAVAILLKSSPILLLGYLLASKKTKPIFYQIGFSIIIILVSLFFILPETWVYYFTDVLSNASQGNLYDGFTTRTKSMSFLFKNLFLYDSNYNPNPLFRSNQLYYFINYGFKFSLLLITFLLSFKIRKKDTIGLWIILLLLLSPNLSSYSLVLLVIPFGYILSGNNKYMLALSCLLLLCINHYPNNVFYNTGLLVFIFGKAILLFLFFLLYAYNLIKNSFLLTWKDSFIAILVSLTLAMIISFTSKYNNLDSYALNKQNHILLRDFEISDQKITQSFYSVKGNKKQIDPISLAISSIKEIENPYSYLEKSSVFKKSSIKKAYLVNDSLLFFMSDLNRSPGFYTLHKLNISSSED